MAMTCPVCRSDEVQALAQYCQCRSCGAHFDFENHVIDPDKEIG